MGAVGEVGAHVLGANVVIATLGLVLRNLAGLDTLAVVVSRLPGAAHVGV